METIQTGSQLSSLLSWKPYKQEVNYHHYCHRNQEVNFHHYCHGNCTNRKLITITIVIIIITII